MLFTWKFLNAGQIECRLDLGELLGAGRDRDNFERNWPAFLASDPTHPEIFRREGDQLIYRSEQLIPEKSDPRPPLLLVLGNPAGHSIESGLFFSFEANGREHRFWKHILRPAGVLDLTLESGDVAERNQIRRERLLDLDYDSPFRVGLAVFISMPSAPGSGVTGIHALFGARTFKRLAEEEWKRVVESSRQFFARGGTAATFQKDAWEGLRRPEDPAYDYLSAKAGGLIGQIRGLSGVPLFGLPPTRLIADCRDALAEIRRRFP